MKKIFNEDGTDIGMVISMHRQGGNWIASITNDKISYWKEKQLHYSIQDEEDVEEWAKEYISETQCLGNYGKLRCEFII